MGIVFYAPQYRADFIPISMEWLGKYHLLEPENAILTERTFSWDIEFPLQKIKNLPLENHRCRAYHKVHEFYIDFTGGAFS